VHKMWLNNRVVFRYIMREDEPRCAGCARRADRSPAIPGPIITPVDITVKRRDRAEDQKYSRS